MKHPLFISIFSFLAGIALAGVIGFPGNFAQTFILIAVLVLLIMLLGLSRKTKKLFHIFLYLFFFLLGILRYTSAMVPSANDISRVCPVTWNKVSLYGTVTGEIEAKGGAYLSHIAFPLKPEKLLVGQKETDVSGTVLVNLYAPEMNVQIGDKLVIGGRIFFPSAKRNPAGFDYKAYLARKGITAILVSSRGDYFLYAGKEHGILIDARRVLLRLRNAADRTLRRFLQGTSRAVTEGVTLGVRSGLSDEVNDIFMKTGTMHILSVSGLHVGIVALILLFFARLVRLPIKIGYFLVILGICSFAVFSGSSAPALRAAFMGSFLLFALMLDWQGTVLGALLLSAFFITFFSPGQLFETSFILSYLAMLSLICVVPLTDKAFGAGEIKHKETRVESFKRNFLKLSSVSVGVWVGMAPVITAYFGMITPSVVISNFLAIPMLTVFVALGFGLVFAGPFGVLLPLTHFTAVILEYSVTFFMSAMKFITLLPFSYIKLPRTGIVVMVLYYAALVLVLALSRKKEKCGKLLLIFLIFASSLFVWNTAFNFACPSGLRVTFFDVGKADSALLEFSDGKVMVIDGGSGGKETSADNGRYVLEPYLREKNIRKIDYMVLTHPHEDHIGGLFYLLENFEVGYFLEAGYSEDSDRESVSYAEFREEIAKKKINHVILERGDTVKGLGDFSIMVFNPSKTRYGKTNEDSLVIKIVTKKGNSVLFLADIGESVMKDMLRFGPQLNADVVKIPHHGSAIKDETVMAEFFGQIKAKTAVITNNRPDKVNKRLLDFLKSSGTAVHITGSSGAIIAEETGEGFRVKDFLNHHN